MKKSVAVTIGALLAAVVGLAIFHVVHHILFCKYRTDPQRSHCRVCGHRKACQKYHRKKWQNDTKK